MARGVREGCSLIVQYVTLIVQYDSGHGGRHGEGKTESGKVEGREDILMYARTT